MSLIVLRAPAAHTLHVPWIRTALPRVAGLDLSELFALVPVRGPTADFLAPPPTSPLPEFGAELDAVRCTPPKRIVAELGEVPGLPGAVAQRIRTEPTAAIGRLADTLQAYWDLALAEHWPRIQALLEADVLWRSRRLALGGTRHLLRRSPRDHRLARRPTVRRRPIRLLGVIGGRRAAAGPGSDAVAGRAQAGRAVPADARVPGPRDRHPVDDRGTAGAGCARRPHRALEGRSTHRSRRASLDHTPCPTPIAHPWCGQPTLIRAPRLRTRRPLPPRPIRPLPTDPQRRHAARNPIRLTRHTLSRVGIVHLEGDPNVAGSHRRKATSSE